MAKFADLTFTEKGMQMLVQAQNKHILTFTCGKLGSGLLEANDDIKKFTDLKAPKMVLTISKVDDSNPEKLVLTFDCSNTGLAEGFVSRELGVFAKLDDGMETLYAYSNAGSNYDYIPNKDTPSDENRLVVSLTVSSSANIEIKIDKSIVYTHVKDVEEMIAAHDEAEVAHALAFAAHNADTHAHPNRLRPDLRRSTAYAVGDIAFHDRLPSWAYLECVQAGTTSDTELAFGGVIGKKLIEDGTVMWKVRSIRQSGDVAGCIKMFAGNTIPDGYLLCDGSVISRTDYADLFAAISTIYGAGDGSTTFTLPNLIGRFIEGAATAGAYINAGLPNITGSFDFTPTSQYDVYHAGGAFYGISYNPGNGSTGFALGPLWKDISFGTSVIGFAANRLSGIYGASGTVQPSALTMLPIIKY